MNIDGSNFSLHFDRTSGRMVHYQVDDCERIICGPAANLWRAPIDNDDNTWGEEKMAMRWREAGLDRLEESLQEMTCTRLETGEVQVNVRSTLTPRPNIEGLLSPRYAETLEGFAQLLTMGAQDEQMTGIAARVGLDYAALPAQGKLNKARALVQILAERRAIPPLLGIFDEMSRAYGDQVPPEIRRQFREGMLMSGDEWYNQFVLSFTAGFNLMTTYTIYATGDIHVSLDFTPYGDLPPLPRIGLLMVLPGEYNSFTYYGRGPHESYPDRTESAWVGVYESTVAAEHVPYIRPQENGNHLDTRWALFSEGTDSENSGLLLVGQPVFNISAHNYTPQALTAARHRHEVETVPEVIVTLDLAQGGLGNASCGPGPLPQYYLLPKPAHFEVLIKPVE